MTISHPFEAFYLTVASGRLGRRFCIYHPARSGRSIGLVVHVHAFAEEMNKARRMVARQARELAASGIAVLQIDLLGCGDSAGELRDATWERWLDDVVSAVDWLRDRNKGDVLSEPVPLWLWGLRAGCLIAADAASRLATPCNLLFWQPTLSGRTALQQFLRLRVAAELLAVRSNVGESARAELAAGRTVEVAGYSMTPELALGFEAASLRPPIRSARIDWLELTTAGGTIAPGSLRAIGQWRQAGWQVVDQIATGPPFWQTTEIEEAPTLIEVTTKVLLDSRSLSVEAVSTGVGSNEAA